MTEEMHANKHDTQMKGYENDHDSDKDPVIRVSRVFTREKNSFFLHVCLTEIQRKAQPYQDHIHHQRAQYELKHELQFS